MSYHQGSVWPLFTGWAAMAEYRGNQPLAGYQLLMENANLTTAQDLGAVTELLSGDYFVPFGRSTSHQLWSSAMVITPTLRGLFGVDIDAQTKTITVNPHLPVGWKSAVVSHINVGSDTVDLLFTQQLGDVVVQIKGENKDHIKLVSSNPDARELANDRVGIQGPGVVIEPELSAPVPGDRTKSFKVISQTFEEHKSTITIEGPAGTEFRIPVYLFWHLRKLDVSGAKLQGPQKQHNPEEAAPNDLLSGSFPPGEGWKTITVTLTW